MMQEEQTVREVIRLSLQDGMEILILIALLETQNNSGANQRMNHAGAAQGAIIVRNALLSRLVLLVMRTYAPPRVGDMHLARAVDLLKSGAKVNFPTSNTGPTISAAIASFEAAKGDHRLQRVKHFRDKFIAHLGAPQEIPKPLFSEVFEFSNLTVDVIEAAAFATSEANIRIRDNIDAWPAARAFWKPWLG